MPSVKPVYTGLFCRGTQCAMIIIAPDSIPAAPAPATARPAMSVMEFFATPQMRDPSSKTDMAARNTNLMSKMTYSFP
jgi:hypothetical protein